MDANRDALDALTMERSKGVVVGPALENYDTNNDTEVSSLSVPS